MAWWERAEVGQKVVYVGGLPQKLEAALTPNVAYEIAEIGMHPTYGVLFGVVGRECGPKTKVWGSGRFWMTPASQFRPVRETSIEQFEAMLNPSPHQVRWYMDELAEHAVEDLRAQGFGLWD